MKLVNSSKIPEVIFNALIHNWYKGANEKRDYSVTELLNPIRITILSKRHYDEIEEDAMSKLWAMMGSAMHEVVEKGSTDKEHLGYMVEKRVKTLFHDKVISGGMDIYNENDKSIIDFKFQTVFNWIYLDDHIENLTLQLNGYRWLLERNGYKVDKLEIIFIFRDYRPYEASRMSGYPSGKIESLEISKMSDEEIEKYIKEKIEEIESLKDTPDDKLPMCSMKDRWQNEDMWKIMFKNKCIKTFYSEEDANQFVSEKGYGTIKFVKGVPKRCGEYCPVKEFCDFYKSNVKDNSQIEE